MQIGTAKLETHDLTEDDWYWRFDMIPVPKEGGLQEGKASYPKESAFHVDVR